MKRRLPKATIVAIAVLGLTAVLIAIGAALDQPLQIWHKAALICYECIGLG